MPALCTWLSRQRISLLPEGLLSKSVHITSCQRGGDSLLRRIGRTVNTEDLHEHKKSGVSQGQDYGFVSAKKAGRPFMKALRQSDRQISATWVRQVRSSPDLSRGEIILLGTGIGWLVLILVKAQLNIFRKL
jgi:hypothetical protein